MNIKVWEGTYTEEDGTEIHAVFQVDGDKLAHWFGKSMHSWSNFRNARSGKVVARRLEGGIIVTLEKES